MRTTTDLAGYLMLGAGLGVFISAMVAFANAPAPTTDRYRATFQDRRGNEYVADYGLTLSDCANMYLGKGYACEFTP